MRGGLWVTAALVGLLLVSSASACRPVSGWNGRMAWSVLDASTGNVTELPVLDVYHDPCMRALPPNALAGDHFYWVEGGILHEISLVDGTNRSISTSDWTPPSDLPVASSRRGYASFSGVGVANGVAYLHDWDGPITRIDLTNGSVSEIPDPFPEEEDPYARRIDGQMLWSQTRVDPMRALAFNLATGQHVLDVTGADLGIGGTRTRPNPDASGTHAVFSQQLEPWTDSAYRFWSHDTTTGVTVPFDLPGYPSWAGGGGGGLFAWENGTLLHVDLTDPAPAAFAVPLPEKWQGTWPPSSFGAVDGTRLVLGEATGFQGPEPEPIGYDDAAENVTSLGIPILLLAVMAVGLVLRRQS